jgi:hypothetical protein
MISTKTSIINNKAKRLSQPVKKKDKPLIIKKLSKKEIKVPTKIVSNEIQLKKVRKTPLKELKLTPKINKTEKQTKSFKEKGIVKNDVSFNQPEIYILAEYKNYINKYKIKTTTQEELDFL